ncbi:MAG: protein kinase, partial [Pirellulales bacterium]|nr:protein kinase [Pirellulales bacterium]
MSLPNPAIPPADASIPVEVVPATSIGFRLASGSELISGYRLQERIGVGGYGEVWSAIAPGGMVKAVKILYGRLEESRASHELKALYRVKGLRHPFLLTLERIEVVDGHLVVVTELADSNLKERFQQCRDSGLPGLPREELLRYLEEAADALDYLSDSHSLQHLDVKPENLLLVSNHVKVGDYGLLKDLQDTSVSMISGLTPRYASPEVFDGRPSRRSDQYSLAIVFQEMATGELPFDGRTSATLATQHLHSAPNLAGLTAQERFAIGKALSKDPVRRFGSCREFVARLMHRGTATILTGTTGIGPAGATGSGRPEGRPAACSRSESSAPSDSHPAAIHDGQTIVVGKPEAISLPAIALGQEAPTYRPAVFIGLGGTGGRVLSRLRQLLTDCYGDGPACPALQFLYIDTDIASINEVSMRAGDGTLREDETIATPLRQTWHYRTSALGNLLSLSRRWIYNIPRSLRTEGMRALGRLALLDHSRQIVGRLRSAIRSAIDGEAVRLTARHTGLGFSETDPRVFLVASIAGGTGGGMVLDTAYAVRQVLAEEGLSDDHVYGILTYSTASGDKARNLAPPSAYACLQELQYFSLDGCDYPGEPGCGLAGFRETGPALKSTYLIDLGDNLEEAQFAQEVDRVATYLLLNSVSPASMFFDKCRQLEREEFGDTEFKVRTVGLAPLKTDTHEVRAQWVEDLSKAVVRRWQGADGTSGAEEPIRLSDYARLFEACETAESPTRGLEKMAAKQMAELRVDRDRLPCLLQEAFRERLGTDVGSYLEKIVSESLGSLTDTLAEPLVTGVLRRVHAIAGVKEGCDPALADRLQSLRDVGVSIAGALGHRLGGALQSWLLELVDTFQAPTAAARQTADWMAGCLESLESEVRAQLAVAETERSRHLERLLQLGADPKANRR